MARPVKILKHADKPARKPLAKCFEAAQAKGAKAWSEVEEDFLLAMQEYDALVADGTADSGDINNGKGDFFNDLLVVLLENSSGQVLHRRPKVPGLVFPENNLDAAYPDTGLVKWMLETKAVGVPRHPGNEKQTNAEGRPASADLDKRIKEASFKNIDIKGETARITGEGGGATSDLASWLRSAPPTASLCIAARVTDDGDLAQVVQKAQRARRTFNEVGLFCYGWDGSRSAYKGRRLSDNTLELERAVFDIANSLRHA